MGGRAGAPAQDGRIQGRWVTPGARPGFQDRLEYFGLGHAWMQALQEAQ